MLGAQQWQVVVADMGLPDMPGAVFLERVRDSYPRLPVLVLSASSRQEDTIAALRAGVRDFMVKPPDPRELLQTVLELAEESNQATQGAEPQRILAIGAHPHDIEVGCGGALLLHAVRGDEITILTLSNGEMGVDSCERARESLVAARRLGARLILLDRSHALISAEGPTVAAIEDAVKSCLPDLIYTHCGADRHQEHRAVYEATLLAAREVSHLLTYQSPSSTMSFRPQRYVNIEEVLEDKLALVASYRSAARECSHLQPELIESTARYWGRFGHYGLVEAFEVVREVSGVHSDLYSSRRPAPETSHSSMRKSS